MYLFSSVINILQSALRCQRKRYVQLKVEKTKMMFLRKQKAERRRYEICLVGPLGSERTELVHACSCLWTQNCDDCNDIENNEGLPIT